MNNYIKGYDLSHWQSDKIYNEIQKHSGFYILKATQGTKMQDDTFKRRVNDMVLKGYRVGAYHYITNTDIDKQVVNFHNSVRDIIALLQNFHKSKNIPFLFFVDWEESSVTVKMLKDFCTKFQQISGYKVIIYTSYSWYMIKNMNKDNLYKYWIAGYTNLDSVEKRIETNTNIVLYQYASEDKFYNLRIDCDYWIEERLNWLSVYENF